MEGKTIAIEFTDRVGQLIKDGKDEVHAFGLAVQEFEYKIFDFNLKPLRYLFIDLSMCEFREGNTYFYL